MTAAGRAGTVSPSRPLGRVLVLVARDPENPRVAGGDRHVFLLAEELAARGHRVTLMTSGPPSLPRRSERNGVHLERIARLRFLGPALWAKLLGGAARDCEFVVEEMIGGARVPFLAPLWTRRPILGFWYQDNTSIFRVHYGRIASAIAGVVQRLVLATHRGSAIVCPSQASRDWLVTQGYDARRIGVFYPSADPLGLADASRGFDARRNRLVTIGNIRPLKRFEEAIDLLGRVRARVPDAELVIVGRRDDETYLRSLVARGEQPDVRGAVTFLLDCSEEQKYGTLAQAKVLTIHSPIEGLGLTAVEAGLCGVPCLVNAGVPAEVFEAGVSGIQVAVGNVEAFTSHAVRLMSDAAEWGRLSEGARGVALRFKTPRADATLESILSGLEGRVAASRAS